MNIVDALRLVGMPMPDNCYIVTLDSETEPTRISFDCLMHPGSTAAKGKRFRKQLTPDEVKLVLEAVQVQKVGYRLKGRK